MRVLMLGWEFPPFIAGGLGTACYGLTRALNALGTDVLFVLPKPVRGAGNVTLAAAKYGHAASGLAPVVAALASEMTGPRSVFAPANAPSPHPDLAHVTFQNVDALLSPYMTQEQYEQILREHAANRAQAGNLEGQRGAKEGSKPGQSPENRPLSGDLAVRPTSALGAPPLNYAHDLLLETQRYAELVIAIAAEQTFDVIHAHDWMTFRAGLAAAKLTGKPLIVHVHSTEYDRSGQNLNADIVAIEREGCQGASLVIAVSNLTKRLLVARYGIDPEKIAVVHNAIDIPASTNGHKHDGSQGLQAIHKDEKVVLFLGRITAQKGPEYFLAAASKVLQVYDKVKFIIAGSGDLIHPTIELAAAMGIGHKVLFTGFLNSRDVERVFHMADLFVMPSVSEPFGIAPLEALAHDVPVIISKQSGVSEVLEHALKVDFWDTEELANKILAVLRLPALVKTLRKNAKAEIKHLTWKDAAEHVVEIYEEFLPEEQTEAQVIHS